MLQKPQNLLRQSQKFLPYVYLAVLLAWGVYVTLVFIGTDAHIVVLLENAAWQKIGTDVASPFLRGLHALVPFFSYLGTRLSPFIAYIVACALFYGTYVAYVVFGKGRLYLRISLSALHVFLFFILSLWLLFTSLFYAKLPGLEPRLLIEPTREVYQNVPDETFAALEANFTDLKDRGCLRLDATRHGGGGAEVYFYQNWCMQASFFTRVLAPMVMLLFFVFNVLVIGSFLLFALKLRPSFRGVEFILSLALGSAGLIALLWFFALLHILTGPVVWVSLFLIPLAGYRFSLQWIRKIYAERWVVEAPFYSASILLFWCLLSYLAFNYLTVIRPFPIGWDDLGRYINLPRQLSVMNEILPGIPAMQWENFTSLGFLLFGYSSTFGAVLAQQINWMAGLFAVLSVYFASKMVLGEKRGLLAALFYYMLPMTGHFSFADMKTENALLFFGTAGLMGIFLYAFPDLSWGAEKEKRDRKWLLLAGIFFGAAFATKPTMILMALMGGVIFTFGVLGTLAGIGSIFLSIFILTFAHVLSVPALLGQIWGIQAEWFQETSGIMFALLGALCFATPLMFRNRSETISKLRNYGIAVIILVSGTLLISAPWMARNMIVSGRGSLEFAMKGSDTVTPRVRFTQSELLAGAPKGSRFLPPELAVDLPHEMCAGDTSREEELDRYWGYGEGIGHYAGLPWRVVMNADAQGYYLTTSPLILFLLLILLLPAFWMRRDLRALFYGTLIYAGVWVVVGNGIPWYGIGMFLCFAIFVEALVALAPNAAARWIASALIAIALLTNVSLRLWQFGMQYNLYEFAWGKASHEVLREMTIPDYDDVAEHVLRLSQNPERPYLYRMGTFISYFIPRNREIIVVNDNQLGFFNCLNQEQDHALTVKRLKALGFHSIVFDTNTATIEKDPNGTLHQKVQRFLDFANDESTGIMRVVNNPGNGIAYMILPEDEPATGTADEASAAKEE